MKITITLITISLFIILIFILKATNKEPYDYKCHNCGKRFRKKDLKDPLRSWHLKDWRPVPIANILITFNKL